MSHMTSTNYCLCVTILLEWLKVVKDKDVFFLFLWYKKGPLTDDGFFQILSTQKSRNQIRVI
jgi:uncharacterized membrane protein